MLSMAPDRKQRCSTHLWALPVVLTYCGQGNPPTHTAMQVLAQRMRTHNGDMTATRVGDYRRNEWQTRAHTRPHKNLKNSHMKACRKTAQNNTQPSKLLRHTHM